MTVVQNDKPGVALQNLVAALERSLAGQDDVLIETPGYLIDKDTGRKREHDVIIRWKNAHHLIVGAIECRDRSRKIGVNEIEAFSRKCERTGVDVPMMVSSNGFYKTARVKAAACSIRCIELVDANSFDWMGIEFFIEFRRDFAPIDVHAFFVDTRPPLPFAIYDQFGTEMTPHNFVNIITNAIDWPENLDELVGTDYPIAMQVDTDGWTGAGSDGVRHRLSYICLDSMLTVVRSVKPVSLHSYSTGSSNFDVVTTPIQMNGRDGQLLLVKSDDGTLRMSVKLDDEK